MIVEKQLIQEAKEKLGEQAAVIIAEDLKIDNFDEKNLKSCCPFHKENTPSFIWNSKSNSFHCFGCSINYNIIDHYMGFFGLTYLEAVEKLFDIIGISYRFGERGVKTKSDFKYPTREDFFDRNSVEEYLQTRKISIKTMNYTDIQSDEQGNIVFHFYDNNDVLSLVKYRPSRKVGKSENKTWCQKGADTKPILFNMNRIDTTRPLVITEGEIDCLSVIESGYNNAVSIPLGAQNTAWIEENWDFLEQFDKIIVWSDSDTPGVNMRKEVCARLGTWRTYYIDISEEIEKEDGTKIKCKDANEVLYYFGKQKVISLIENAEEVPIPNIINLNDVNDFDIENADGLYSGFDELDNYIYKFLLGTIVIVTGRNGNGKSVLLNQMFVAEPLNQGMDVFYYSAELGRPILKSWIELVMAGRENISLKNNTVHKLSGEILKPMREWYDNRVFIYDNDKDNTADTILNTLETVVRKNGVKLALIDNLLTIDLGTSNQDQIWQEQKKFVVRLVNFASKYNILIVLVAHPRKTSEFRRLTSDDIGGSGDITNLAHYVMAIHRYTKAEKEGEKDGKGMYKKGKEPINHDAVIDLFKNRITGHANKEVRMFFDYLSYRFYTKPSELWKRFKWDKSAKPIPTNDPNKHTQVPDFIEDDNNG